MNKIDLAVNRAIEIANDDSHGYDQIGRWGPDYDCSSMIITAWEQAGVPVKKAGATNTWTMRKAFESCGFKSIPAQKSLPSLIRGDVLLNENHHTCMYIGDGKVVQASINEKGGIYNGKDGDQTGREINISPLYIPKYGWDYVLRYTDEEVSTVNVTLPVLSRGSIGAEVGTLQILLNALGFGGKNGRPLKVDHNFGENTAYALSLFQKKSGLNPDEICGAKSWSKILSADYN